MTEKTDRQAKATDALARLQAEAKHVGKGRGAPADRWNPPFCGDLDMRIAADGTWVYLGTPIGRKRMVKLFASVLRREEDGKYYLVTPVEKVGIRVDDAPFLAVEMRVDDPGPDQVLFFRTNVDDEVRVDEEHPLRFATEEGTGGLKPYVLVRGRLEALITRAVFYDLVALGTNEMVDGVRMFGVWSAGGFLAMAPEAALAEA